MLPFWPRFKNSVLQNLTATYFRGLLVNDTHCVPLRSLAFQKCWWPLKPRNKVVTGGLCLLMVPGAAVFYSTSLTNTLNNLPICNYSLQLFSLFYYYLHIILIYISFIFVYCIIKNCKICLYFSLNFALCFSLYMCVCVLM